MFDMIIKGVVVFLASAVGAYVGTKVAMGGGELSDILEVPMNAVGAAIQSVQSDVSKNFSGSKDPNGAPAVVS